MRADAPPKNKPIVASSQQHRRAKMHAHLAFTRPISGSHELLCVPPLITVSQFVPQSYSAPSCAANVALVPACAHKTALKQGVDCFMG